MIKLVVHVFIQNRTFNGRIKTAALKFNGEHWQQIRTRTSKQAERWTVHTAGKRPRFYTRQSSTLFTTVSRGNFSL